MLVNGQPYRTVWWEGGAVRMIDQRRLPHRFEIFAAADAAEVARAIRDMIVRGAPAIGAAAAFGLALAARRSPDAAALSEAEAHLRATRPTAQNLFAALDRVRAAIDRAAPADRADAALEAAQAYADAEVEACRRIGEAGAVLIPDGATVLTHCNAGWLGCVDWGTALAPLYAAHRFGRRVRVLVDETRPRLQGANLTAWELMQEGIEAEIIVDNAAGLLMSRGEVDLVLTGADRIAANGDAANKIGTLEKALLAREFHIPFYVAAPLTTIDPACPDGSAIPIEERDPQEVLYVWGLDDAGRPARVRVAPDGARARNPAFDVTPAAWITSLLTEHGAVAPDPAVIARVLAQAR